MNELQAFVEALARHADQCGEVSGDLVRSRFDEIARVEGTAAALAIAKLLYADMVEGKPVDLRSVLPSTEVQQ